MLPLTDISKEEMLMWHFKAAIICVQFSLLTEILCIFFVSTCTPISPISFWLPLCRICSNKDGDLRSNFSFVVVVVVAEQR